MTRIGAETLDLIDRIKSLIINSSKELAIIRLESASLILVGTTYQCGRMASKAPQYDETTRQCRISPIHSRIPGSIGIVYGVSGFSVAVDGPV